MINTCVLLNRGQLEHSQFFFINITIWVLDKVKYMNIVNTHCVFISAKSQYQKERDTTPKKLYAMCSLTYLGAMLASNHALQHVAYPTQVCCYLF